MLSIYPEWHVLRYCHKRKQRVWNLKHLTTKKATWRWSCRKNYKNLYPKRLKLNPWSEKIHQRKKLWIFPDCSEIFWGPITDDWIECISRRDWCLEDCTDNALHSMQAIVSTNMTFVSQMLSFLYYALFHTWLRASATNCWKRVRT